jgi:magnesium transporter
MTRLYRRRSAGVGDPPGSLTALGDVSDEQVSITIMDYDADQYRERPVTELAECEALRDHSGVLWIDIDGVHDTDLLKQLGAIYGLHGLTLEDIFHTGQRPKFEEYPDYLYVVCRMMHRDADSGAFHSEQISLVLGRNFVISFQEHAGDVFDPVRTRIRHGQGRIRRAGADYLMYALLDAVVDNYFVVIEGYADRIEQIETRALTETGPELLHSIHEAKQDLIEVRRAVWPLREAIGSLMRDETPLVRRETHVFLRDVHDHTIQVAEIVETSRDLLTGLQDVYLSNLSHHMNEVMKVLTIIATIFVPLTFVAGIWGMNFDHMPELHWRWGYLGAWVIFVLIAAVMLIYFRRKRWL